MKVVIKETGEKDTFQLIDPKTGTNWAQDLIGNAGALDDGQFVYDDEQNAYLVSNSDYDWWSETIRLHQTLEARIAELNDEYGKEAVDDVLRGIDTLDLQDDAKAMLAVLEEAFGK